MNTFSALVRRVTLLPILLWAVSTGCVDPAAPEVMAVGHHAASIATDQPTYVASSPITVIWDGLEGLPYEWVAIRPQGAPDDNATIVRWSYTNSQPSGSVTFTKGAPPGTYEAKAYQNGTYVPLATTTFVVEPPPAPGVSTNKVIYAVQEAITVSWVNMPGNPYDYVTLVPAGAPPGATQPRWAYTGGTVDGSHTFNGLPEGNYEARVLSGVTGSVLASQSFSVIAVTATIATAKSIYLPSEAIQVSWTGAPTNPYTYVALVASGAPAMNPPILRWSYTGGMEAGALSLSGIAAAGDYEARLYSATSTLLASAPFAVSPAGSDTCTPPATRPVFSGHVTGELVLSDKQFDTVPLTVPLESSILFTSVRENEPSPNHGSVMCRLHDAETITVSGQPVDLPAGVTCMRNAAGTDSGSGTLTIRYTVVTFSSGVTVQRGVANTGFTNPTTISLDTIDPDESFVILGGQVNGGTGWGSNEFVRAQLSGSTLELRTADPGTRVAWQVVSMTGASVQRGTTSLATNQTSQNVTISNAPSGSIALASYTTTNASGTAASVVMLSTRLATPTSLSFQRQSGGTELDISWEVISLPFATYSGTTNFVAGQASATIPVAGANFDSSNSVAIASTQSLFGPSSGSSSYVGGAYDLVGEAAFTLAAGTNAVTIERASTEAAAQIPWTVIDFSHSCDGQ